MDFCSLGMFLISIKQNHLDLELIQLCQMKNVSGQGQNNGLGAEASTMDASMHYVHCGGHTYLGPCHLRGRPGWNY